MAKATVNPGSIRKQYPSGEHITKIMYDDNEPPKNYIWGKPDGYLYVWNGSKWVLLNDRSQPRPADFPSGQTEQSIQSIITNKQLISKTDLDARLKILKNEIISYLTKLINMKDCPDSGDNAIEWFREYILPEINGLKDSLDGFATELQLSNVRQELLDAIADLASSEIVTSLVSRIAALEQLPHDTYVTQTQLNNTIGAIDFGDFVTAEEITDIHSLEL